MSGWRPKQSSKSRPRDRVNPPQNASREAQEVERLRQENERLRTQVAEQAKRIVELERELALHRENSTTSSKPPSSDGLAGRQRERGRRKKSRRKPGGQAGHPGHTRPLVPLERVNEVVPLYPDACRHCQGALPPRGREVTGCRRHQVTELPPIEPQITEFQCHAVRCPGCGHTTQASLPEEATKQLGPQLTALIAYLTVVCRLPRRVVQRLLEGVLQLPISLGSTHAAWEESSTAVATPCHELQDALSDQPVLNGDETGHRTNGDKRTLWVLVAPQFVVYWIARTKGAVVLRDLIGADFKGVLGSDRAKAYLAYHPGRLQFCWAHFTRNLLSAQALARAPAAAIFCREALALKRRLFRLWHRFADDSTGRGGALTRAQLVAKVLPIQQQFFRLAARHLDSPDDAVRNLAVALFTQHEHFFEFVHHDGVAPTNNSAERALRTAVQWRKIMFGTRSVTGEVAVARLLTVMATCQLQQLSVLAYLTTAIQCHRRRQTVPSLLPKRS